MSAQENYDTSEIPPVDEEQPNEEEFIDVNEVGEEVYDDDRAAQPHPDDEDADDMEINDDEGEHEHETLKLICQTTPGLISISIKTAFLPFLLILSYLWF